MNKVFFGILLLFCAFSFAQKYGMQGGLGLAYVEDASGFSGNVGFVYQTPIQSLLESGLNVEVSFGLGLNIRKVSFSEEEYDFYLDNYDVTAEIPVAFHIFLGERFFLLPGIQFGIPLYSKIFINYYGNYEEEDMERLSPEVGLILGAGFKISDGFSIDFRYLLPLRDYNDYGESFSQMSAGITYYFGGGGSKSSPANSNDAFKDRQSVKESYNNEVPSANIDNDTFKDPKSKKTYKIKDIDGAVWFMQDVDSKNWKDAKRACPSGWHLPNNSEWEFLQKTLDNDPELKKEVMASFTSEYWWSATENSTEYAPRWNIFLGSIYTTFGNYSKNNSYSVRCVQD